MRILAERDEALQKANKAEKQLEKLKTMPKPVTIHLAEENFNSTRSEKLRLGEENEYLQSEVNRLK